MARVLPAGLLLVTENDDFMGKCLISLDELFDQNGELSMRNQCIPLNNVKVFGIMHLLKSNCLFNRPYIIVLRHAYHFQFFIYYSTGTFSSSMDGKKPQQS